MYKKIWRIKNKMIDFIYDIGDAVLYDDRMSRVEDRAINSDNQIMYLIQLSNLHYLWVEEDEIEGV